MHQLVFPHKRRWRSVYNMDPLPACPAGADFITRGLASRLLCETSDIRTSLMGLGDLLKDTDLEQLAS